MNFLLVLTQLQRVDVEMFHKHSLGSGASFLDKTKTILLSSCMQVERNYKKIIPTTISLNQDVPHLFLGVPPTVAYDTFHLESKL